MEEVTGPFLDAKSIEINSLELDLHVSMTQCGIEAIQGRKHACGTWFQNFNASWQEGYSRQEVERSSNRKE